MLVMLLMLLVLSSVMTNYEQVLTFIAYSLDVVLIARIVDVSH
jgi:hypothetical protein